MRQASGVFSLHTLSLQGKFPMNVRCLLSTALWKQIDQMEGLIREVRT